MHDATFTESELFSVYWDDGLLDLLCGLALLATGCGWLIGLGAFAVIQAPLWTVLWTPLRQRLIEPRAGYVEFSRAQRQRTGHELGLTLGLGIAVFVLAALIGVGVRSGQLRLDFPDLVAGLPAALIAVAAVLAALLTGARRFYAYAVVLLACAAMTSAAGWSPAVPITVAGILVSVSGAVLFMHFIRSSRQFQESS